jgi:hypothetical protein
MEAFAQHILNLRTKWFHHLLAATTVSVQNLWANRTDAMAPNFVCQNKSKCIEIYYCDYNLICNSVRCIMWHARIHTHKPKSCFTLCIGTAPTSVFRPSNLNQSLLHFHTETTRFICFLMFISQVFGVLRAVHEACQTRLPLHFKRLQKFNMAFLLQMLYLCIFFFSISYSFQPNVCWCLQ